ncbi:MAG: preprotein translocase subunit SecE [Bacteroidetes bacterium]|jgi:preprotein translocase subunit SecE|nr:preprotein translocase subunit SecE [Bacteroidota bacterium]MBL0017294.1 preprotein translocase subunit SecE [Bacteroidota bacterium]MBP6638871.1 preprotein translocase subunit SecE [Bacteroidia bacterium]MBP6721009.1 preprotein translocase subunit SecE [Bacteroidia bacterium]MBP8073810.1 preprotein translocase subunit SecE [Bacteroidia bacterium]
MDRLKAWFQTYSDELLYKVQWPTVPELQSSTITVLVASLLIAFVIFVLDIVSSNLMSLLYGLFN